MNKFIFTAFLITVKTCYLFDHAVCQQANITIEPVITPDLKEIPWMKEGDESWKKIKPTFSMADAQSDTEAKGWICITDQKIKIAVEVKDDVHFNTQLIPNMWKEDGLQISLDMRGDGTGGMPNNTRRLFGPDDEALGLALINGKTSGIVWTAMNGTSGNIPQDRMAIYRNEKSHTTFYQVILPWSEFKTKAGIHPTIGVAVWINDKDPGKEVSQLKFGGGADGIPGAGLFEKLKVGRPPEESFGSALLKNEIWSKQDAGEMILMYSGNDKIVLEATDGQLSRELMIEATSKITVNRYKIRYNAPNYFAAKKISVSLRSARRGQIFNESLSLNFSEYIYNQFLNTLDSIANISRQNQLFTMHLTSLKALAMTEWGRLQTYRSYNPALASEVLGFIKNMYEGILENGNNWQTFLNGERPLVMSFISARDNTLQFYQLTLPKNWNIEIEYPLFMELHGAGNPNPLANLSAFQGLKNKLDLFGYDDPKSFAQYERSGYHVAPFGRGNSDYVDIGSIDIWEAFEDVSKKFKINDNKRYLFGFSMGGGGTFINAARTPDVWAAIAIYAGAADRGMETIKRYGLAKNMAKLPVWIWCGEDDSLIQEYHFIKSELIKFGNSPEGFTTSGDGHSYRRDVQEAGIKWMQQFTRKRPDVFSFIVDSPEHNGIWGIHVKGELSSQVPQFECSIAGNEVTIISNGAPELEVNPGKGGLGLTGNVRIVWNGKEAYSGAAVPIHLK